MSQRNAVFESLLGAAGVSPLWTCNQGGDNWWGGRRPGADSGARVLTPRNREHPGGEAAAPVPGEAGSESSRQAWGREGF